MYLPEWAQKHKEKYTETPMLQGVGGGKGEKTVKVGVRF